MWWEYIKRFPGPSSLFPEPWGFWALEVDQNATVLEVASARDWLSVVDAHPVHHRGFVYPDWTAIAARWDAVHMTAAAILATQGVCLRLADGSPVAAPFWDVESTFWLRWVFAGAERIAVAR